MWVDDITEHGQGVGVKHVLSRRVLRLHPTSVSAAGTIRVHRALPGLLLGHTEC
jgi:hypothetical protein